MGIFRRKPKSNAPPPEDLNVRHTFVDRTPGSNTVLTMYPTAQPAGKATYATHIGSDNDADLWPLGAQEAGWAHYDRVPDSGDPRIYYAGRESDKNARNRVEIRVGTALQEAPHTGNVRGDDAKWNVPPNPRPTNGLIPVNGHELINTQFGHHTAWNLTGTHSSMALVHRNYPIGGMAPQQRLRNTLRVTPPSYDATSADIDSANAYSTQAGIYVSPGAASPGISYGLKGGH